MDHAPFFTIIVPCYNRAHLVGRALRSCIYQTFRDFEVILVIDARSSDNINALLAHLNDSRVVLATCSRTGASAVRNCGIDLARGQYIAFLDSDDIFLPDKLFLFQREITKKGSNTVFYSQIFVDRGVGRFWVKPARGLRQNEDLAEYLFVERGWIHTSTLVVPTELARSTRYDERISFGDDQQFALRLFRRGAEIVMIDQPLSVYDDVPSAFRLSQGPTYSTAESDACLALIHWIEAERGSMSRRAYLAYYALFLSRYFVHGDPVRAIHYIWEAYRGDAITARRLAAQLLLTFAPRLHRYLTDWAVRAWGTRLGPELAELWSGDTAVIPATEPGDQEGSSRGAPSRDP